MSVTVRVTSHAGLLFSARDVIHDGVEAAEVSEHEVEPAVREDTLHQADEVGGEVDAAVAQVPFDGTEGVWRAIVVDGQVVGSISMERMANENRSVGSIGYMIQTPFWSQGIGTEAVRQICGIAFRELTLERKGGKAMDVKVYGLPR